MPAEMVCRHTTWAEHVHLRRIYRGVTFTKRSTNAVEIGPLAVRISSPKIRRVFIEASLLLEVKLQFFSSALKIAFLGLVSGNMSQLLPSRQGNHIQYTKLLAFEQRCLSNWISCCYQNHEEKEETEKPPFSIFAVYFPAGWLHMLAVSYLGKRKRKRAHRWRSETL